MTPTLAPTRSNSRSAGFTLLEVLVVMVIAAGMVSAMALSTRDSAETAARRFAAQLLKDFHSVAGDAVLSGEARALLSDGSSFYWGRFSTELKQWQVSEDFPRRELPEGVTVASSAADSRSGSTPLLVLSPGLQWPAFRLELSGDDSRLRIAAEAGAAPLLEAL